MKKKIKIGLLFFLCIFLLIGCSKKTDIDDNEINNTETDPVEQTNNDGEITEETDSGKKLINLMNLNNEDINNLDMKYYYYVSEVIEDFYLLYEKLGISIDEKNEADYMKNLKKAKDLLLEIKNYELPTHFDEAHEYLIESLNLYVQGVEELKHSYDTISLDKYKSSGEKLIKANDNMSIYYSYIAEFYEDYSEYINSFFETDYYLTNLNFYEYNESFSEDENNYLFKIGRYLELLTLSRENLTKEITIGNKDKAKEILKDFNKYIEEIAKLKVDNENLKTHKEKLGEYLEIYSEAVIEYYNQFKDETINYKTFKIKETLDENSENIYNVMSYIGDFYKEYDIDIGFQTTDEQKSMLETE